VAREEWPDDPETLAMINAGWDDLWGDRRQEIVFIGQDLNRRGITDALDACLLADDEMTGEIVLEDPFPVFQAPADHVH